MKLSLAMIVKNEEAHLGHCLASVRGLVDEVIVVDTGSTDGTAALAEELGARVFHRPWTEDFAAARNESLAHATGDWVLVLDADEAVDALDHAAIREACARPGAWGYRLLIRNYLPDGAYSMMDAPAKANPGGYGEGAGQAHCVELRNVRLFRRMPWTRYRGRLHELVDPAFQERGLPLADLDAVIHHYGQTLADRVERKLTDYLDLARKDVRFTNREPGAGCRRLLDDLLLEQGITAKHVKGYEKVTSGHFPAARLVQNGEVDCCISTRAVARALALDFIPLAQKPYHLVIRKAKLNYPPIQALLETLGHASFRREVEAYTGYSMRTAGDRLI